MSISMSQTIDAIFLSHAARLGETTALTDCRGAARLGLSTIDQLTYKQAARFITATSGFFRNCHFINGDIALVQMPNIAETPLVLLSLLNAGLVPCLIPGHWRRSEIDNAIKTLKPSAIIAHQSFADYNPFSTMFEIAANHASVRYLFGLGDQLPDGVTPLPDLTRTITSDTNIEQDPQIAIKRSGEQAAFISWSHQKDGSVTPVAYTHVQLMANSHLLNEQINLTAAPSLLATIPPMNLTGLLSTFIPWALEGGSLHIASSIKPASLVERIIANNINLVILPQTMRHKLSNALSEAGINNENHPHMALISPTPYNSLSNAASPESNASFTHIYNLNGLCLYAQNQASNSPAGALGLGSLHLGPQPGPNGEQFNPPFIETRIQGATQKAGEENDVMKGRLELNGTAIGFTTWQPNMTTTPLSNFDKHWEKTNLTVNVTDQSMSVITIEKPTDDIFYGSAQFSGPELDKIYQTYPGFVDAAAFSVKDPLLGERLFAAIIPQPGNPLSYEDFKQHLIDQQISPAKIPEKLVTVFEIPRSSEGFIDRSSILNH